MGGGAAKLRLCAQRDRSEQVARLMLAGLASAMIIDDNFQSLSAP